ncbi:hypothetical protein BDP27DRAFT_1330277 [Rhodocollybia butyracea]|uniref:F-box domain-containing protein n=1 Tax=Rhodocollybia butyracea TaxID=206335 RepID=A0A9P5U5E1_9AGAR|nr:hypothetical protein BDP27DRAFT_1330277 [Rhodocollybia butyracea]
MSSPSLLTISPELQLTIISHLSLSDKRCLILTCQTFNNLLALELAKEHLEAARDKRTILLIEDAHSKELGSKPFIITDVRKVYRSSKSSSAETAASDTPTKSTADSSQNEQKLLVDIYYPRFMRNYSDYDPAIAIDIAMEQLVLQGDRTPNPESTRLVKSVKYKKLRGGLVKASASFLRRRFVCPECQNSREVCPGCGGFSGRFPELFTNCGWAMPCPVCIGYGVAEYAKFIQDDYEELDALWKEIITMLKNEGVKIIEAEENADSE